MNDDDASVLLDGFEALRHPCDLDLLIFFVKHPSTLMASEQLSAFMGYDIKQLAQSVDVLIGAGLVTRSQPRTRVARMYMFTQTDTPGGGLPALVSLASTRIGRVALLREIKKRAPGRGPVTGARAEASRPSRRPVGPALVLPMAERMAAAPTGRRRRGGE